SCPTRRSSDLGLLLDVLGAHDRAADALHDHGVEVDGVAGGIGGILCIQGRGKQGGHAEGEGAAAELTQDCWACHPVGRTVLAGRTHGLPSRGIVRRSTGFFGCTVPRRCAGRFGPMRPPAMTTSPAANAGTVRAPLQQSENPGCPGPLFFYVRDLESRPDVSVNFSTASTFAGTLAGRPDRCRRNGCAAGRAAATTQSVAKAGRWPAAPA